ncbi:hypothetical protein [Alicyclobacillus shizuokensis]|uniref:hypothetical protein n=1 Tax=Alicyclobacillus shizuokensis TaxID=392014 RepID=UPI0008377A02|nr:hypothetical protein [Alicyclobacillus shizuokensis]MCL6626989.1 hypothetical protein [Alicyclobacillus shizuokensis]
MPLLSQKGRGLWLGGLGLLLMVATVLGIAGDELRSTMHKLLALDAPARSVRADHSAGGEQASAVRDVPDSVVAAVAQHVGGIQGLDELVVLPHGNEYLVSATVNVASGDPGAERFKIAADVQTFFAGIFASDKKVQQGELSFLSADGDIVASAGLGRHAYQAMSVSAMGKNGIWFTEQMNRSEDDSQGVNASWFQVDVSRLQ